MPNWNRRPLLYLRTLESGGDQDGRPRDFNGSCADLLVIMC
jgi:hypothetical protein